MNMSDLLAPKLTSWKNEPTIKDLKDDFTEVKSSQSAQVSKIQQWLDLYNVTGGETITKVKGRSSIQPMLIRKHGEWKFASMSEPFLSTPELFKISPVSHEDRKAANQNELVLNNQFNTHINTIGFIDALVRKAVIEGTAIIRVGWETKTGKVKEPEYEFDFFAIETEEEMQKLQEAMQMQTSAPDSFNILPPDVKASVEQTIEMNVPVKAVLRTEREVEVEKTIVNKPTVEVVPTENVYIDPTCRDNLDKASFVIYSFTTSLAQLKADGRYTNLDKIESDPTGNSVSDNDALSMQANGFKFKDKPRAKIVAYEYWGNWDIHGNGTVVPIVATWVNNTLIRMEENPYPDKKPPFVVVSYMPVMDSVYGEPDAQLLKDNQRITGAVTRGMVDLLGRSANGQTGYPKQMLDVVNKRKFEAGMDYEYNPNANPNAIVQHKFPELPASGLNMLTMMNNDAEALSGSKAFGTGGISGASLGQTAAGVRSVMDATSKREMGSLRRLSNGVIEIGRKIIAMNAVFLDEESVVRVTNEEFVKVRRDDLAGNFDMKLTISTAEADQAKAEELAFLLQTMGNTMDFSITKMVMVEISRLRKMPDLAKRIEEYEPQPDPVQQELQQLEVELKKAQIALTNAQAQEAGAKGMLNQSKVPVEAARANNIQNDADKKTLDFAEQEAGIQHNREVELEASKQANQRDIADRNNASKAITDGLKIAAASQRTRNAE